MEHLSEEETIGNLDLQVPEGNYKNIQVAQEEKVGIFSKAYRMLKNGYRNQIVPNVPKIIVMLLTAALVRCKENIQDFFFKKPEPVPLTYSDVIYNFICHPR